MNKQSKVTMNYSNMTYQKTNIQAERKAVLRPDLNLTHHYQININHMQISTTTTEKKLRIGAIYETPLSSKKRDIITAAERYLADIITVPMMAIVAPCFTNTGQEIDQRNLEKIAHAWRFNLAAYHLQTRINSPDTSIVKPLLLKSKRLYEQEAQRILGSLMA